MAKIVQQRETISTGGRTERDFRIESEYRELALRRRREREISDRDAAAAVREAENRSRELILTMAEAICRRDEESRRLTDLILADRAERAEESTQASSRMDDFKSILEAMRGLVEVKPVVNVEVAPAEVVVVPAAEKPRRTKVIRDPRTNRIIGTEQE